MVVKNKLIVEMAGDEAKQAFDSTRTPQEQYQQRLADLGQHMGNLKQRIAETTAASGQKYFPNKDFGVAVAAVLAGSREKSQLPSYHRQAGMALSGVSPAQKWFEEQGLGDATQAEKLRGLAKRNINTVEELTDIGFKEIKMRDAIMDLVANVKTVDRYTRAIGAKAKPGIFQRHRAEIEKELPVMKTTREISVVESWLADDSALGKAAGPAAKANLEQKTTALALKRMNKRTSRFHAFSLMEGEPGKEQSTVFDVAQGALMEEIVPATKRAISVALLSIGPAALPQVPQLRDPR